MSRVAACAVSLLLMAGCDGVLGSNVASSTSFVDDPAAPTPVNPPVEGEPPVPNCGDLSNIDVMQRLEPHCGNCHGVGTNKAYFGSVTAFESILEFVVQGDPQGSPLVAMLEGRHTGQFQQMPLGGSSFAELSAAGSTFITMEEIYDWVMQPQAAPGSSLDYRSASTMRRITGEQVLSSFEETLGLVLTDTISANLHNATTPDVMPALSPDISNVINSPVGRTFAHMGYPGSTRQVHSRFFALGAPHWLAGVRRSNDFTSAFAQTISQMAQNRCRLAIELDRPDGLFRDASPSDTTISNPVGVRDNIAYMHLKMLAEPASGEELDELVTLFQVYESVDAETAWTAVCSVLVRDPRWLLY